MEFRWVQEGDSERLKREYVKRRKLENTSARDTDRSTTATPSKAEYRRLYATNADTAATPTKTPTITKAVAKSPSVDVKPQAVAAVFKAKPQPKTKAATATVANVSEQEDPKKQANAAERAMRACLQSMTTVCSQALLVSQNLESAKDWSFLKSLDHTTQFKDSVEELEKYKNQEPMIKTLILNDVDFGPESL